MTVQAINGRVVSWRQVMSVALGVLAGTVATAGTLAVAVAGFTLSYDAIRKVGIASGVRPDWAWLLPVSVDGAMAVATVTAVVLRRMGRKPWYPWGVVIVGAGISIACNAVHARMRDAIELDDYTAMAVSAIPALMLTLSVHLLVVLTDAAARALAPVGEPAQEREQSEPVVDDAPSDTPPEPHPTAVKIAGLRKRYPRITQQKVAERLDLGIRTVQRHWPVAAPADASSPTDQVPVNGRVPQFEGVPS